ncbi:hypothetical protein [Bradyrhizobium sp. 180]
MANHGMIATGKGLQAGFDSR